ncbi:hypothetical protein N7532_002750 [Penicillium argentinense]|uniref:High osmolarity sensitivity protein 3 n=1 Tax=Penicillium argentinense TaxID=1131581 RepID=A0A9W9G1W5_9EURO|nr:uncharacterized protein N7532_002750 [Penicillium argentinense]KAJ5110105.1 hypothetical protein N7532_002750 [Penicillium argentinense]
MPPLNPHRRTDSHAYRPSILPSTGLGQSQSTNTLGSGSAGSASMSAAKQRQYAHLHSQLAQLNANLADTENLLRMTAVQAGDMRFLGGYVGALFMGSARVIGEEGVKGQADVTSAGGGAGKGKEEGEVKVEDSEEE